VVGGGSVLALRRLGVASPSAAVTA
jgi:hypothetical protein